MPGVFCRGRSQQIACSTESGQRFGELVNLGLCVGDRAGEGVNWDWVNRT
jgi:hypothetical protein